MTGIDQRSLACMSVHVTCRKPDCTCKCHLRRRVAAAVALALILAAITAGAAWTPPQPNVPAPAKGIIR